VAITRGHLYAGTSGFAYPAWAPTFYPPGTRGDSLLSYYATRLPAVELNNTFYQQPRPEKVASWLAATPAEFKFVVKAQRGGSMRAFGSAASETVSWLTGPYRAFGRRLGNVLYRVPDQIRRDDTRLRALLDVWPSDIPLTVEFQHESWHADQIFELLKVNGAALCATDLDDGEQPDLRLTGKFIYLRLRRTTYAEDELSAWADRLEAFLADGVDCYVFLRHDESGESALRALRLVDRLDPDEQGRNGEPAEAK
jgi:uncharacterized protein YecE (DUF72 family)